MDKRDCLQAEKLRKGLADMHKKHLANLRNQVCPNPTEPRPVWHTYTHFTIHHTLCFICIAHSHCLQSMTEGASNSFGGLSSILEKFERSYLVANNSFDEHSVFLLGPPLVIPETERVTFAVSSENLLLNAYRQTCFGLPPLLCVDTTHRLMIARQYSCSMPHATAPFLVPSHVAPHTPIPSDSLHHSTVLVGTMSVTQHFHIIAYAICSHEDAAAHEYVFRLVFEAVDKVVADRARTSTPV